MRQMQGGGGGKGPMSFGKSKARLLSEDQIKTTFADVAGVDEAKEDVKELVDFLRDPSKFQRLGGRIPKDRKSTRLNSSHVRISYAVFCLKKKKQQNAKIKCDTSNTT